MRREDKKERGREENINRKGGERMEGKERDKERKDAGQEERNGEGEGKR